MLRAVNRVEYISTRIAVSFLCLFCGYVFYAILPGFYNELSVENFVFNGKLGYILALIQLVGIAGAWFNSVTRNWISTTLNVMAIILAVFYVGTFSVEHIN